MLNLSLRFSLQTPKLLFLYLVSLLWIAQLQAQDTFSIVAMDTITGEVGSAGASCLDLTSFQDLAAGFIAELVPGLGAIATQAYYTPTNQANALRRMNNGDTPAAIIAWLLQNDVDGTPDLRQYGIVAMINGTPKVAAHTGNNTDNYKNHIIGSHYSIQGNILLDQQILDSMEYLFLNTTGDLACKLMAALQGAKRIGADTRCAPNGTSSLFAFLKVAQPSDTYLQPSFSIGVKTAAMDGIEPIDTLQTLFDHQYNCALLKQFDPLATRAAFRVFPNPFEQFFKLQQLKKLSEAFEVELFDVHGTLVAKNTLIKQQQIDTAHLPDGIYFLKLFNEKKSFVQKVIKAKPKP